MANFHIKSIKNFEVTIIKSTFAAAKPIEMFGSVAQLDRATAF